jgi:peptide/nickel transport system ATP-binding protein/oligopeptide transport system ATP-binding protein
VTTEHAAAAPAGGAADAERILVSVRDLKKHFEIRGGVLGITTVGSVKAVDGVSFDVRAGETLGLVGESGCGKTTLGKVVLGLIPATSGEVQFKGETVFSMPTREQRKAGRKPFVVRGERLKRLRKDIQVVFQDPYASLNPRMSVGEIVGEGPLVQGVSNRKEREEVVRELLGKVGLNQTHIHRYPHEFSGGQRQRIGIARALAVNPSFVVCDEPVSALDVSIQSQVLNLLNDLQQEMGLTYLFIAHNLAVVEHISDRVGVMYLGVMAELAGVDELYANPRHPYTVALLSAIPSPDPRIRKKRLVLKGDIPSPANPPSGCRFHTRCWLRERLGNPETCATDLPAFRDLGGGHLVACHYAEEMDRVGAEIRDAVAGRVDSRMPTGVTAPAAGATPVPAEHPQPGPAPHPAG